VRISRRGFGRGVKVAFSNREMQTRFPVIISARRICFDRLTILCALILLLLADTAYAAHPYLWFDATQLNFMRNKVVSGGIAKVAINNRGGGCSVGDLLSVVETGAGQGEVAVRSVNRAGGVTGVTIPANSNGDGYSVGTALPTASVISSCLGVTVNVTAVGASGDWLALRASCDEVAGVGKSPFAVQYPSGRNATASKTRGFVYKPAGSAQVVLSGLAGNGWEITIDQLGACYQAIRTSDPKRAAAYLTEAHYIIQAMAQPLLKMVRQSDGLTRYGVSIDSKDNDLRAGQQVQLYQLWTSYKAGDVISISAPAWTNVGCTDLLGTFVLQSVTGASLYFAHQDGSPATVKSDCKLFSVVPTAGDGYGVRFYMPSMAKAYDWFYGDSTNNGTTTFGGLATSYPGDLDQLAACMTAWLTELQYVKFESGVPEGNYSAGFIWGATAAYVAFNSDQPSGIGALANQILAERFSNPHGFVDYTNLWMKGGGNGEGLEAYGYGSILHIIEAEYAMWDYLTTSPGANGADWRKPPTNFNYLDDNLQYFMEFVTPTLLSLDGNEDVFSVGQAYPGTLKGEWFPTEPVYVHLDQAVFYTTVAARMSSKYASQFFDWYAAVYAAERANAGPSKGLVPEWNGKPYQTAPTVQSAFLFYNPSLPRTDWATLPLMYRGWGGNYSTTRSAWNNSSATIVRFLGGPTVGAAGGGHTQFESGAVTVQAGNNRLSVYGLEESARAADVVSGDQWEKLANERRQYGNPKNSVWWCNASESDTANQGPTSRLKPPGLSGSVTSFPSQIDLAEDQPAFTYLRAVHLEANGARSVVDKEYHQVSWTREVFFLRPKLVVVHDLTQCLNANDYQKMIWALPRTPARVTTGVPAGMTRYDVTDQKSVYHGALWSVLPSSAAVNIVNHDGYNFLYRAEVIPREQTNNDWLAVLDTANAPSKVNAVTKLDCTNADCVQFDDANHTLVAFSQSNSPQLPITIAVNGTGDSYIAGLTPHTNYKVVASGNRIVVNADDGTHRLTTTDAGILRVLRQ
jgi:hypothetical protein